jgi:hypothetical protein
MIKIGILGCRGIPNHYGGFEKFAEILAIRMVKDGYDVSVYCSSEHPLKTNNYKGVKRICKKDPEKHLGTFGQFIYDLFCILDSHKRKFDIILQLGYTSSSVWYWLLPRRSFIITNMDGLEWQRSKYGKYTRYFLKYAEMLAARHSDYLVTDAVGIQNYLKQNYNIISRYIAYGASLPERISKKILCNYGLRPYKYHLIIARLEPENNIELIIQGYLLSESDIPLVIVGKQNTPYGKQLTEVYKNPKVIFMGSIFNDNILNSLRFYSFLYFHGHSVGGTNPSLLEAMASKSLICANDNIFNREVLGQNAFYFKNQEDISILLQNLKDKSSFKNKIDGNIESIHSRYNWDLIITAYELMFMSVLLNQTQLRESKEYQRLLIRNEVFIKG